MIFVARMVHAVTLFKVGVRHLEEMLQANNLYVRQAVAHASVRWVTSPTTHRLYC